MLEQIVTSAAAPKARATAQPKFPLPNPDISFERHWEILKAYVLTSKEGAVPLSYKDFGRLTVSPTHISANNKFFESIGLISRVEGTVGKYVPTQAGITIQRELTWKRDANARARLAELLKKSWFWESTKNLLSMRGKAALSEIIDQLGYDAGADPAKHKSSLGVLVEYLLFSQSVVEEDGLLILREADQAGKPSADESLPTSIAGPAKPDILPSSDVRDGRIMFGILISPESTEDQIRRAVRTILDEIGRTRSER